MMRNSSCKSHLYSLHAIIFGTVFLAVMCLGQSDVRGQTADLATAIQDRG